MICPYNGKFAVGWYLAQKLSTLCDPKHSWPITYFVCTLSIKSGSLVYCCETLNHLLPPTMAAVLKSLTTKMLQVGSSTGGLGPLNSTSLTTKMLQLESFMGGLGHLNSRKHHLLQQASRRAVSTSAKKAETAEALAKALREVPSEESTDRARALFEQLTSLYCKQSSELSKAELAEALAKALREAPSEAPNDKACYLFHELKKHFLVPSKGQTQLGMNDAHFLYVLISLIGAFVISETVDVSSLKQNVKNLHHNSQKSDETIAKMGRQIFQLQYHYSAIKPERCLNCMKLSDTVSSHPEPAITSPVPEPEGASVSPGQSPHDGASAGPDLPTGGFWSLTSWKRWICGEGSA